MDIDDDEQDPLPVFRHFTRDDLADIHHLIFENKLAEKKKAEKLAKNKAVSLLETLLNLLSIVLINHCCDTPMFLFWIVFH